MSVNRFEIMPLLLCAKPHALVLPAEVGIRRPVTMIIDIREGWATDKARTEAQAILDSRYSEGAAFLRIGIPDDAKSQDAIRTLAALRPDGFVLSGCSGVADIQKLDVMLRVAETECGLEAGAIAILAECGEMPAFFLSAQPLGGVSARLKGLIFDATALTKATASQANNNAAGRSGAPALFARAAAVLKARAAGLSCYELLADEPLSSDELHTARDVSLADGFSGVIARDAAHLAALAAG
jgi:citrate lyase subunit beta / citryl-CoA lyase